MDKKARPMYILPTRNFHQIWRHTQTEREEIEKIFHANVNKKKDGLAILMSDTIEFKTKIVTRDEEWH